jgi:hypothetical protein
MKRYKVLLSLFCVVVFIFLAVGSTGNDEEPAAEPEEVVVDEPEEVVVEQQDNEALEQAVLKLMQDSFEGTADIEFVQEEETFYITPTDPAFILDLVDMGAGESHALEAWDSFVDEFKVMSETMGETLPGYWVSLRNPANPDNLLLIASDGSIIYNFIED